MTKKLHAYDYELIDRLKYTYKPFATNVAQILEDDNTPKVIGYRAIVDCLISLETINETLQAALTTYKLKFGELSNDNTKQRPPK